MNSNYERWTSLGANYGDYISVNDMIKGLERVKNNLGEDCVVTLGRDDEIPSLEFYSKDSRMQFLKDYIKEETEKLELLKKFINDREFYLSNLKDHNKILGYDNHIYEFSTDDLEWRFKHYTNYLEEGKKELEELERS